MADPTSNNPIGQIMKHHEAIIEVMRKNGGYATLALLYQEVPKMPGVKWNTKTPFASIRRVVQTYKQFFKIKPGLWALEEYRNRLPQEVLGSALLEDTVAEQHDHTYYQGLLVQIGNLRSFETYIPAQDKSRLFVGTNQPLGQIATRSKIPEFGYSHIVDRAKTIDVIWFNERNMPSAVFEVEHSTDMQSALVKYVELQDFNIQFVVVSDQSRKSLFDRRVSLAAFKSIEKRVEFISYEQVADRHLKYVALGLAKGNII